MTSHRKIDDMVTDLAESGVALSNRDLVLAHVVAEGGAERLARKNLDDIISRATEARRARLLELARAH